VWGLSFEGFFPDLFACASNQNATIDSLMIHPLFGPRSELNVTFICNFKDWELEGVVTFLIFFTCPYQGGW
jgi:hypothetical protein